MTRLLALSFQGRLVLHDSQLEDPNCMGTAMTCALVQWLELPPRTQSVKTVSATLSAPTLPAAPNTSVSLPSGGVGSPFHAAAGPVRTSIEPEADPEASTNTPLSPSDPTDRTCPDRRSRTGERLHFMLASAHAASSLVSRPLDTARMAHSPLLVGSRASTSTTPSCSDDG